MIVYGAHGVCRIAEIEERDFNGSPIEYYRWCVDAYAREVLQGVLRGAAGGNAEHAALSYKVLYRIPVIDRNFAAAVKKRSVEV